MKATTDDLIRALRTTPRASGADLCRKLKGINRSTLMRLAAQLGTEIIRCGGSRRIRYALRRALRGRHESLPLYRIDAQGEGHLVGRLDLTHPEGSALKFVEPFPWPLDDAMCDGWFESLPYPVLDMRFQGFMGRNFAHRHWRHLDVTEGLDAWSDDDIAHSLATLGHDQPGNLILGEAAYALHLEARREQEARLIDASQLALAYPALAEQALNHGEAGSSAGGEFPKFAVQRIKHSEPVSVIVKFSGADGSATVRRWSDLLVCEHLALDTLMTEMGIGATRSELHHYAERTFLEVERFDRQGAHGRLPVCTLASLNGALLGMGGAAWPQLAAALSRRGWLDEAAVSTIERLWWFGRLIANSDMHDGNLTFSPGLNLAPVYDMLPMLYAPQRGGEVPLRNFTPPLPLPQEKLAWQPAARAAAIFWQRCAGDERISADFRTTCAENARQLP
jgi:hypothetical protein